MALTLAEVHSRVRDQVRDTQQQVFSQGSITNLANDWLRFVAANSDAFWTTTTFSTVASTRTYNLAADFLQMIRVVYNASFILPQVDVDQLLTQTADITTEGTPSMYYIQRSPTAGTSNINALLGLFNVPSTSSVLVRYFYRYSPAAVTSMASRFQLPPGFDNSIVPYICWQLKKSDREMDEAERYKREFQEGFTQLVRKLNVNPDEHRTLRSDTEYAGTAFARLDPSRFENP